MPSSQNLQSDVRLVVDGHIHDQWESYRIDSHLLIPADDWELRVSSVDDVGKPIALPVFVQEGADVKLFVGDDLALSGLIDTIVEDDDKWQDNIVLSGRDYASRLLDCSAPILDMQQATLEQVIRKAVGVLGITQVRYQATPSNPRQKVHTEPGQSIWEWLRAACEANHVWPWFAPDGTLIIGQPDYTTSPVADLITNISGEGNNIKSTMSTRSIVDRYSEVIVFGQAAGIGSKGSNVKATSYDTGVKIYRPKIIIDGNCETLALAQARDSKEIADGRLAGRHLTIKVAGHRIFNGSGIGRLWEPGMRVNLSLEHRGVFGIYYLIGRTFTRSRRTGTETILKFVEDGAWMLNLDTVKAKRRRDYHTKRLKYLNSPWSSDESA